MACFGNCTEGDGSPSSFAVEMVHSAEVLTAQSTMADEAVLDDQDTRAPQSTVLANIMADVTPSPQQLKQEIKKETRLTQIIEDDAETKNEEVCKLAEDDVVEVVVGTLVTDVDDKQVYTGENVEIEVVPDCNDADDVQVPKPDIGCETEKAADVTAGVEPLQSKSRTRRCIRCSVCLLAIIAVSVSAIGFLKPRYPEWEITKLSFSEETKTGLLTVFTDPSFDGTAKFDGIDATVRFYNANYVGAQAEHGQFTIFYDGIEIGVAECFPVDVPARSNVNIDSTTSLTIYPKAAKALLDGVLANAFTIGVHVEGVMPSKAFGFFGVKMHVACDVKADALQLLQDPNQMVTGHDCTYSVGL